MNTKINLEYFGMPGHGATVKEAKANAGRKIEKALEGSYQPIFLTAGADTVILWREPTGWAYGFLRDGQISGAHYSCDNSQKAVEKAARAHLGANATDWRTCFSAADVHPVVIDQTDRREIASNCRWQRQYRAACDAGLTDNDARYAIGGLTQLMSVPMPTDLDLANVA